MIIAHRAQRHYCEHLGIDIEDVGSYKSKYDRYYWILSQDYYSEHFDIQVF